MKQRRFEKLAAWVSALLTVWFSATTAQARTIIWTNPQGGNWSVIANWSPRQIPTGQDNVYITNAGVYTVVLNSKAKANSLVLGGPTGAVTLDAGTQTLEVKNQLRVGARGILQFTKDLDFAALLVEGVLNWNGGKLKGQIDIASSGRVTLGGNALKVFSPDRLTNQGLLRWEGDGSLQLLANLTNHGVFEIATDAPLVGDVLVRYSVVNTGTLRKTDSMDVRLFSDIELANAGTIELNAGTISLSGRQHNFASGARVTGPGQFDINGGELILAGTLEAETPLHLFSGKLKGAGPVNGEVRWVNGAIDDPMTINGPVSWMGGKSSKALTIQGATFFSAGEIASGPILLSGPVQWTGGLISSTQLTVQDNVTWAGGELTGNLLIRTGRQLTWADGNAKLLNGGTLTNLGTIEYTAADEVQCKNGAKIFNYGSLRLLSTKAFKGDNSVCRFYNYGTLELDANSEWKWDAWQLEQFDTLRLSGGTLALAKGFQFFHPNSQVIGTGQLMVDKATLTVASNVVYDVPVHLKDGTLNASGIIDTPILWEKGVLAGTVTIPPNRQLLLQGNGNKTLAEDALVINHGLIRVADGTLAFGNDVLLTNLNLLEIHSSQPFSVNGDDKAWLYNSGTLRRSVSSTLVTFGALRLDNAGLLDLQSSSVQFTANTHTLRNGSQMAGPGETIVSGAILNVAGEVLNSAPLRVEAGQLIANGRVRGPLIMAGGKVSGSFTNQGNVLVCGGELTGALSLIGTMTWSDGTVSGLLEVSQLGLLNIASGGTRLLTGTIDNQGTVVLLENAQVQVLNGTPLVNRGTFEFQHDTPFRVNGSDNPILSNGGRLRKTTSTQPTTLANVRLHNGGVLELESGDLFLTANSHVLSNATTIVGTGSLRLAGATVTLNGSLTNQTPIIMSSGSFLGNGSLQGELQWSGGNLSDAKAIAGSVNWSGGTLAGTLSLQGVMEWLSGTVQGTLAVAAGSQLYVNQGNNHFVYGVLSNDGHVTVVGNSVLQISGGTPLVNRGVLEIQSEKSLAVIGNGKPTFSNLGTFLKTGVNKTLEFTTLLLVNRGTIDLRAGDIAFRTETHRLEEGTILTGPGSTRLMGATLVVSGNVRFDTDLQFTSGILNSSGTAIGGLTWSGGDLTGSLTMNGPTTWSGGRLLGTLRTEGAAAWSAGTVVGTLTVAPPGQLTVSGADAKIVTGLLNNQGQMVHPLGVQLQLDDGATLNDSGLLACSSDQPWKNQHGNRPTLNNTGIFRKLGPDTLLIDASVQFMHSGLLDVTTNVVSFQSSTHSFNHGARFAGPGLTVINGASITLSGTITNQASLTLADGLLTGNGTICGDWSWTSGALSGMIRHSRGTLNIDGPATKLLARDGTLENNGTLQISGAGPIQCDTALIRNLGRLSIAAADPFTLTGSAKPVLSNLGVLSKAVSPETVTFSGMQLQHRGELEVLSGAIEFTANTHYFTNSATVRGPGRVRLAGATFNLQGRLENQSLIEIASGTVLGSGTLAGPVNWSGGVIDPLLTVDGNVQWTGGQLDP